MSMLEGTSDLQLVLLPFSSASQQQADELADAAGEGEVSLVEELLQRPQDPDANDRNGETPLYRASLVGSTETARLLLEAGADFDLACGQHHLTALVVAAGLGHVDTVRVLLQAGADQELYARGYVTYSNLCNKGFQQKMKEVAQRAVTNAGVDVGFPERLIMPKRLQRLLEKTRDAAVERAGWQWPKRNELYLRHAACFYILDTVRLSFSCRGETPAEQVKCCMKVLEEFEKCTVEAEGVRLLRRKSGFASGVRGEGGYADVKLLCYTDLGVHKAFDGTEIPLRIIGEVQLILQSYEQVKHRMHLAYEARWWKGRGDYEEMPNISAQPDSSDSSVTQAFIKCGFVGFPKNVASTWNFASTLQDGYDLHKSRTVDSASMQRFRAHPFKFFTMPDKAWTAAAPVAEAGTTGESGGCSSPSARPEPVAFEDEGAEEVKEEAAGTTGESGACSSPSNRPGAEPFSFNFEDVADEAIAEAPSSSELAAGTAGETGACSSPSTRPVPLAFDEDVDEEGDPNEVPAAQGSGAFSPPEPFATFAFQDEATNIPAPEAATGNAASTGSAASPLAQPEPFAFDEGDEVQEEAKASSPPARQADLSFDDEEEAQAVEASGLAEQCRSSSEEAEEPQSEVPAAALEQSPLSFDEDEEADRQAPSRSVEDGRQSPLAFDEEDEDEKAKAAPAAETSRQSAFAFDDEDELEATAPAAAETARHTPLTFEDDDDEDEVPAAATGPARQAPLAFDDEEEAPLPAETARQAPLSFGDEDEGEEEVPEASPQTSRPWASAQSEPVEPEDEDDDEFADFASAGSPPTVSQPSAPGAKDEEEEDENWAFSAAPTSPEPSAANMEELANSVQQLLSRWNEVAKLATAGLAMSLEDDGAAGEEVPGSDDCIRAAVHMPEEAAQLIQSGVSDGAVSSLPLGLFGAPASPDSSSLGSTVREGFFAALGKHLQLPSAKPEAAATSPQTSRPSSPQTLAGVSAVPAQVVGQAAPVQPAGAEEAMADVDFGFFEVSTTPKVPAAPTQVSSSLDADVLSQALSSVGLQNTAATSTVSMTPDIALTADTGVPRVKKKKKGMTQKVKSFLSGLPDLKHLYSKSVVE
ncbi:mask [Symbiodinium sp. CCMP2592]|nr:mask [Symbiodinium sp. CCMP2592]